MNFMGEIAILFKKYTKILEFKVDFFVKID
jgi:hypothetical protein